MLKTILPLLLLSVAVAAPSYAAPGPSVHQIYEAAQSGQLVQAQQMMDQVLRDHPRSAKAHYVAAELYAREGRFPQAREELNSARRLDPTEAFANPAALRALTNEVSPTSHLFGASSAHDSSSWVAVLLIVAGVGVLMFMWRRRNPQQSAYSQYSGQYPNGVPANGPVMPGVGGAPAGGMGLGSSLASGLAVGAGVVAGEELARHFLDSDRRPAPAASADPAVENPQQANSDLGGNDFGVTGGDNWDDSDSGGDSGGGGDDWS